MRYHLDTTFLIDWQRVDPRVTRIREEMVAGRHTVSVDPIVETEFFAAQRVEREKQIVFNSVLVIARWLPLTSDACRLAAEWLGRLDIQTRRRHFGDALIVAIATRAGATLVTADQRISRVFPVDVFEY